MVVVDPNDVSILVGSNDRIGETLVDRDVLLVGGRLVERLCLGSIGDGIVKAWPEDLVAELVVTARKLGIRNPNGKAVLFFTQSPFHVALQALFEAIGIGAECADPELLAEPGLDAGDGVLQASVAVRVRLDMPCRRMGE